MSISNVKNKNQVSYESAADDIFIVHRSNRVFSPDKGFICSHVMDDKAVMLVTTVDTS